MCNNDHGRDNDKNDQPDGKVELSEGAALTKQHPSNGPNEAEDDEADSVLGKIGPLGCHLGKRLSVCGDDDANVEGYLERLEEIDCMARHGAMTWKAMSP